MNRGEFDSVLLGWKAGTLTANEALRQTSEEWRVTAHYLYGKYETRLPSWVSWEDVLQVVLMHVPRLVQRYVPFPGGSISRYVCSQAILRAEKAVHRWRGVRCSKSRGVRNPRAEPSHHDVPMEHVSMCGVLGGQEELVHVARLLETLVTSDYRMSVALDVLRRAHWDVGDASRILWNDPGARLCCDLRTETETRGLVRRTMREIEQASASW